MLRAALAVFFTMLATAAAAQAPVVPMPERDWRLTLGATLGVVPKYEGSSKYELRPLPYIDASYQELVFVRGLAAGVNLVSVRGPRPGDGLRIGALLRYGFGREESDDEALRGLGDIDDAIELGGFASYSSGPWIADLQLVKDVAGGHEGVLADAGIAWRTGITPRMRLTVRASTTWADDIHMQNVFGISATQSARSGLPVHDADSGFKTVGLALTLGYGLTQSWSISGRVGYARLIGDAADSPIVDDRGSKNQFSTFLTVAYEF